MNPLVLTAAKKIVGLWDTPISEGGCQPTDDGEELCELDAARELAIARIIEKVLSEDKVGSLKNRKKGIR